MQRTLAAKLAVIAALALALLIPIVMVQGKIAERASYRDTARQEVARSWTGPQLLMTPVVVLSYRINTRVARDNEKTVGDVRSQLQTQRRYRILVADSSNVSAELQTKQLRQGIYRIPVYATTAAITGELDNGRVAAERDAIAALPGFVEHIGASLSLVLGDTRGISESPVLDWDGSEIAFEPGSGIPGHAAGVHAPLPATAREAFSQFRVSLSLNGTESFHLIPAALEAELKVRSSWPHPKFVGAFLPNDRSVDKQGFHASWRVNHFSSGIDRRLEVCARGNCDALKEIRLGVTLIDPVDVYLQSERATKYAILFIGLSFIAFFVFEVLRSLRIHPIQYALVGLSLSVFFLLLIALSEHLAFALAYAIAALACIGLLVYYVKHILEGWRGAMLFGTLLGMLYGALYIIIGAEDFALLGGAFLVFVVLGTVMIVTRNIDWYGIAKSEAV